jgi:hypothetical protein
MEAKVILFRRVACKQDYVDTEVFVTMQGGVFDFPARIPKKYRGRTRSTDSPFVHEVLSTPFDTITPACRVSFEAHGMWITEDDTVPKGNVDARVFGIPLSSDVCAAWSAVPVEASKAGAWRVRVGYHGTDVSALPSICTNSLKPSLGQLGFGVYVGSFWKACRFAVRDQDYSFRSNPVVVRVLWLCNTQKQLVFPQKSPCPCSTFCALKSEEKRRACGHELHWLTEERWQNGFLPPSQFSDGKWITRNEEWVMPTSALERLQQVVRINVESVNGPNYDPEQRNIEII